MQPEDAVISDFVDFVARDFDLDVGLKDYLASHDEIAEFAQRHHTGCHYGSNAFNPVAFSDLVYFILGCAPNERDGFTSKLRKVLDRAIFATAHVAPKNRHAAVVGRLLVEADMDAHERTAAGLLLGSEAS